MWDVAVNEVYGLWHVDGTGLLTQSADGDGFLCYTWILEHEVAQRLAQSCTKFFLMWMVVIEGQRVRSVGRCS